MAVTKKIVTNNFNVLNAKKFVDSFSSTNDCFYLFGGKHITYDAGDSIIDTPDQSLQTATIDIYDNMIYSKKISNTDVSYMIKRNDWATGTVYDEYVHDITDLQDLDFFIVTKESDEYNIFKCLFNNDGANSTVAPTKVGSSIDLEPIETGDGYIWKYMFTIPTETFNKFSTPTLIPLVANNDVINGATSGRIEVIKIESGGAYYNNYIASGTFIFGDIKIDGSSLTYGAPSTASSVDNYYKGCAIRITSGAGIGQYKRIDSYIGTGDKKKFVLESEFDTTPAINDTYEVYPYIYVWGDGNETEYADAIAIVESEASNSISSVEVLKVGMGYRKATTIVGESPTNIPADITTTKISLPSIISDGINFEAASLKPIISPVGGHGSDPYNELFANRACISVKFNKSEGNTIPFENDVRQFGIIKNPSFDNVEVNYSTVDLIKSFSVGETVAQYKQVKLFGNVTITAANNLIKKTDIGKISSTVEILSGGSLYDSAVDTIDVNNTGTNGDGFAATFANDVAGVITGITVSNQGNNYISAPTLSVISTTGTNGIIVAKLSNPQRFCLGDSLKTGDYILVTKDRQSFLSKVSLITSDEIIVASNNSPISVDNAEISKLEIMATGKVQSIATGYLKISNVSGEIFANSKIIGLTSGAFSTTNNITLNEKTVGIFDKTLQLTRLIGNFEPGSTSFEEDEYIYQSNTISEVKPRGYLHNAKTDSGEEEDVLYLSNVYGKFTIDSAGEYDIFGNTSGASVSELDTKYNGDFVKDSGQVIYFENIDPITRSSNKSEVIKIILGF